MFQNFRHHVLFVAALCMLFSINTACGEKPTDNSGSSSGNKTFIGAIRWDAWTGGEITVQVEKTLGPAKYHYRLPWFAKIVSENKVVIDGSPQQVMDREIEWAAASGIDYWAILIYPGGNSMSGAIKQYLKSPVRNKLKFCMILCNTINSSADDWIYERNRIKELIIEPGYLKVQNDRPLIYVFNAVNIIKNHKDRIEELRAIFKREGLNPYWVFMGWNPANDWKTAKEAGFDAVTSYAYSGSQTTFSEFAFGAEELYWVQAEKAGAKLVPLVTSGWDKRPRIDNPVSWERTENGSYHSRTSWPPPPTPGELAGHLTRGISFISKNPVSCEAKALLIYAWNEYDEGGWIAPTLGKDGLPDSGRLDAIREVVHGK
jgi:hypothetical protein